ncbi:MAG: hypothetical protein M1827_004704 [Pycnora praestabilis]|nr:MAG: hypothetical protein M1827_004704 [Pycnora praestabilis]
MERPQKRSRISQSIEEGRMDPDVELQRSRNRNNSRLKSRFESIFDKYSHDFSGVGDEINLETGEVVVNNGHLLDMRDERDVGDEVAASLLKALTAAPGDHDDLAGDFEGDEEDDHKNDEEAESGLGKELSKGRDNPNPHIEAAIMQKFGIELGPQIVNYIAQIKPTEDANVEPAWRTPIVATAVPEAMILTDDSNCEAMLTPLSERSVSPPRGRSLWAPEGQKAPPKQQWFGRLRGKLGKDGIIRVQGSPKKVSRANVEETLPSRSELRASAYSANTKRKRRLSSSTRNSPKKDSTIELKSANAYGCDKHQPTLGKISSSVKPSKVSRSLSRPIACANRSQRAQTQGILDLTSEECQRLIDLKSKTGMGFKKIAEYFPDYSWQALRSRYYMMTGSESSLFHDATVSIEDDMTRTAEEAISRQGKEQVIAPKHKNGDTRVTRRQKSREHTAEDDRRLLDLRQNQGLSWKQIAVEYFPERSMSALEQRYRRIRSFHSDEIQAHLNTENDIENSPCIAQEPEPSQKLGRDELAIMLTGNAVLNPEPRKIVPSNMKEPPMEVTVPISVEHTGPKTPVKSIMQAATSGKKQTGSLKEKVGSVKKFSGKSPMKSENQVITPVLRSSRNRISNINSVDETGVGLVDPATTSPETPVIQTPGGNKRRCGEAGWRCEKTFCLKCT